MALCCLCFYGALLAIAFFILRLLLEAISIANLQSKSVFITGCDSGFGNWLALKLLRNGVKVFAGCFTGKGEEELQKQASSLSGHLETVSLDVTKQDSVDSALQFVSEKLGGEGLWGLVNNAGILGNFGNDDFLTVEDYQKTLDVNTLGVIRVTQAFKSLIKKSRGRIVTVASVCGRVPGPGNAPYTVSKFAVEAYCDAIRQELHPYKVDVAILEPGFFKTNLTDPEAAAKTLRKLWDRAAPEIRKEYGSTYIDQYLKVFQVRLEQMASSRTDFVVDAYYHALTSRFPRKRYWVGYDSMFFLIPASMLPTCLQDLLFHFVYKMLGVPQPEMNL